MAVVVTLLGVASALFAVIARDPYASIAYEIKEFGAVPVRIEKCAYSSQDGWEFTKRTTPSGKTYSVDFCFRASKAMDGRMLIPFHSDANGILMNEKYSKQVTTYMETYVGNLISTPDEAVEADSLLLKDRIQNLLMGIGAIFIGIISFWIFVAVIGWIVRGFMGIPNGQDARPKAEK